MPVKYAKINNKHRVVEADGSIATNDSGTAIDGGGHESRAAALAQVGAVNSALQEKMKEGYKQARDKGM